MQGDWNTHLCPFFWVYFSSVFLVFHFFQLEVKGKGSVVFWRARFLKKYLIKVSVTFAFAYKTHSGLFKFC